MKSGCLVPADYSTIQKAVDDVACKTISLAPRVFPENVTIARDVVIVGAGQDDTVITAGQLGTIITITKGVVELRDLTIKDGEGTATAGGIANAGSLTLTRVAVRDCRASGTSVRGAGIHSTGPLVLDFSSVENNSVKVSGAGELEALGGGIYMEGAELVLRSSMVAGNRTSLELSDAARGTLRGGGVYSTSKVLLEASGVNDNELTASSYPDGAVVNGEGGGIYLEGVSLDVRGGSVVAGNTVYLAGIGNAQGGGVFGAGSPEVAVEDSSILLNHVSSNGLAAGGGVALAMARPEISFTNSVLAENIVEAFDDGRGFGGGLAIFTRDGGSAGGVEFVQSRVVGNSVTAVEAAGGGLYLQANGPGLINVQFEESAGSANSATAAGAFGGFAAVVADGTGARAILDVQNSTIGTNELKWSGPGAMPGRPGGSAIGVRPNGGTAQVGLYNATVAFNNSFENGALSLGEGTTVSLANSIVSANWDDTFVECDSPPNAITSWGYNLYASNWGCAVMAGDPGDTALDVLTAEPDLDPVGLYDGSTEVAPLRTGSPAIDAGNPAGCGTPSGQIFASDQRGHARSNRCDIGAYEY